MWVVALAMVVSCSGKPSASSSVTIQPLPPSSTPAAPATSVATPGPRLGPDGIVHINKKVLLPDCEWWVIEARDAGKEMHATNKSAAEHVVAEGRFIFVHFRITNLGKKEILLERPHIVDARGRRFGPIDMESSYMPPPGKGIGFDALQPNLPREFWTVIEVPAGLSALDFEIQDFSLVGPKQTVPLGL